MTGAAPTALEDLSRARCALYRFLLAALDKPTPAQHAWLLGPDFRAPLALACAEFGLPCPDGPLFPDDFADHQSRYLACFEVGLPEPPVVLLASHYNRREPVPATIHEHVLFYRRFGARVADANREPADHLLNELAFLVRLDDLLARGHSAESVRRARGDFLARQVLRWVGRAARAAEEKGLPDVYQTLLGLLAAAVAQDAELTAAAAAQLPGANL
jgi:TorA maturation chaperone TorD